MDIGRIVPNLTVTDLRRSVHEHAAVLGLEVVMDHGWIVTLAHANGRQLSLISQVATAPMNPDVSVFVDDITVAYDAATDAGVEIVHPLTAEDWGVTAFSTATPLAMWSMSAHIRIDVRPVAVGMFLLDGVRIVRVPARG